MTYLEVFQIATVCFFIGLMAGCYLCLKATDTSNCPPVITTDNLQEATSAGLRLVHKNGCWAVAK